MQDMIRTYDGWRTTGSIGHPTLVKWMGFPSQLLEARVGSKVYRGAEALDKMSQVITGADTRQIFNTGVDQALPVK
jgi:hypothetical protein